MIPPTAKRENVFTIKPGEDPKEFERLTFMMQLTVYLLALAHLLVTGKAMLITALVDSDGGHAEGGKHPQGRAVDIRAKDKDSTQRTEFWAVGKMVVGLFGGVSYWEAKGTDNEHFHFGV